ncbi:MAG: molybdenum ABC transporter ATP-binding protein [Burkholderiaceae bacterium]|nr:molybdenum ABC transporter ATP-binding protein [Burkholderiaceae bacterium]
MTMQNRGQGINARLALKRVAFTLDVDLQLPSRGVTVLFGPSGSGKTTILRCVAGLEQAVGQVVIDGQVWLDTIQNINTPTWQRDLGYVFQEASLFAHLSVEKNLQFGLKRIQKPEAQKALSEAIELLGISRLLNRNPGSLSGGERQRVAIARALALQPRLLLLDEPLASLDQKRREEILPWLERLHTDLKIPVLYVTHSMQELTRLADYVVLLESGGVKLHGPIQTVLADPAFAAAMGGEAGAILHGRVAEHDEAFHLTRIDLMANNQTTDHLWVRQQLLAPATEVRVHVHANDVSLTLEEPQDTSIQNRLQGIIESINPDVHPANRIVAVDCRGQRILARVTARALQELKLGIGSSVWCQIKSVALAGH